MWASKDGAYGYAKARAREEGGQVTIVLEHKPGDVFQDEIDIVPPVEGEVPVVISPEEKAANDLRLAYEDSLRNSYVATFVKPLANDPENDFLVASEQLEKFLLIWNRSNLVVNPLSYGMRLLSLISEKRDTPASVLLNLNNYCGRQMYPQQQEIWCNSC